MFSKFIVSSRQKLFETVLSLYMVRKRWIKTAFLSPVFFYKKAKDLKCKGEKKILGGFWRPAFLLQSTTNSNRGSWFWNWLLWIQWHSPRCLRLRFLCQELDWYNPGNPMMFILRDCLCTFSNILKINFDYKNEEQHTVSKLWNSLLGNWWKGTRS